MLDLVSFAGFAPLHYELYWWIGHHVAKLTPIVMRLVPAISGTLMVPAVYFLARQLVSIRTALVAALLATVSAYLLVYSRDAKMYMPFWLMCTLSMGCFVWWLRGLDSSFSHGACSARDALPQIDLSRGASPAAKWVTPIRIPWYCWLASSIAM